MQAKECGAYARFDTYVSKALIAIESQRTNTRYSTSKYRTTVPQNTGLQYLKIQDYSNAKYTQINNPRDKSRQKTIKTLVQSSLNYTKFAFCIIGYIS